MSADIWAAVAAIAAAVTAAITLVIAYANTSQTRTANMTADFANCLAVVAAIGDAQRRTSSAENEAQRTFEFNELLNLLEALAGLHNDKKLTPSTRKLTEDFLDEAWAFLSADPATMKLVEQTVTSSTTYAEMRKFAKRHESRISELTAQYAKQIADGNSKNLTP